jgi:DNA-binding LytR/AlgR family response regulator
MQNIQRVLIRTAEGERVVVDPLEVFVLEADEGRTRVRLASRHELVDVREIGELEALFAPFGFMEIHRSVLVNPRRVALIRRREGDGRDWELKMEPPVNRVLPISRDRLEAVLAIFGDE